MSVKNFNLVFLINTNTEFLKEKVVRWGSDSYKNAKNELFDYFKAYMF